MLEIVASEQDDLHLLGRVLSNLRAPDVEGDSQKQGEPPNTRHGTEDLYNFSNYSRKDEPRAQTDNRLTAAYPTCAVQGMKP